MNNGLGKVYRILTKVRLLIVKFLYFCVMKSKSKSSKVLKQDTGVWEIILYNDDVNTIQYVIATLVSCCNHGILQAEQCALLAQYKGQCSIKRGDYKSLLDLSFELNARNLKTEII